MNWFRTMKVGVKLILGFLIVAAIAAAIGIVGIANMRTMDSLANTMYAQELMGLSYMKEANIDLMSAVRAEKNVILASTQDQREKYKRQHGEFLADLEDNLSHAGDLFYTSEGKAKLAQLRTALEDWKGSTKGVVSLADAEELSAARQSSALSMGAARDKLDVVDALMGELTQMKEANAKAQEDLTTRIYQSNLLIMICLVIGGVLLGIVLGVVLTSSITSQLGTEPSIMMEIAGRIAQGDLTLDLELKKGRKARGAFASLKDMKDRLTQMVVTMQESAEQVASSSEEITASAQKLAEGAQSQASTLEETSASMEELSASVDQVSDHAQSQAAAVEQGSGSMEQVHRSIEEVSKSLQEIETLASQSVENALEGARAVNQVVDGINLIAGSSEKIGGIVNVISDIADQTNLLALNAAIEAARAGEHGRGFAVVADEVSKLADRSSASTKEIEGLIRESVRNVTRGVEMANGSQKAMDQIRGASEKVKDMIEGLTRSMNQQVQAVKELSIALQSVSEMSQSISAATEEQTTNAKQVSKAVESVNDVTQSSASAAEEMSAATEHLSQMAQELQALTAQFKIAAETSGGPGGNGDGTSGHDGDGRAGRELAVVAGA
ncbi:MAG TPA: methyl-accepting chemotaxis protein [Spirochaetia bacterium]